jgi:hypothetical protein
MTAPVITGGSITGATFSAGSVSAPSITTTGDTNTGIFFPAADTIAFAEGGVESMRINSSGQVGIGTSGTTIGAGLDVVSGLGIPAIRMANGATSSYGYAQYGRSSTATQNWHTGSEGDGTYRIYNGNLGSGTLTMTINSSGNVGIGILSPATRLQVAGNISLGNSTAQPTVFLNNTTSGSWKSELQFQNSGALKWATGVDITAAGNNNYYWYDGVAAQERMRIDNSGNVGIGTSSPSARLNIANTLAGGATLEMKITDTTNSLSGTLMRTGASYSYAGVGALETWLYSQGSSNLSLGPDGAGVVKIVTNGFERMRISSAGLVGIGTNNPVSLCHVAGNFLAQYAKIAPPNTTSDFVGISLENTRSTGGTSFIDSQGINAVTDSHIFFNHGGSGNFSSSITFGTQPTGTNSDRRVARITVDPNGNLTPNADNAYTCGGSGLRWSAIWAANGTIQTSDARAKTEIEDSALGLDFINQLRPVSYIWIEGGKTIESTTTLDENGNPVFNPVETSSAGTRRHFGLLAQEVKDAIPDGIDFGGWLLTDKNNPESQQALRYDQFISPLIKAIQEQQAIITSLTARIAALESK